MLKVLIAFLLACVCTSAPAAASRSGDSATREPFHSKLGMHLIGAYTEGTRKMVRARMPVLKILDTHHDMIQAARDYKRYNPDGIVVLRCYTPVRYTLEDEPVATAERYWREHIWKQLGALSEEDRRLIDYLEGTNEVGECPTWEDEASTEWFTKFSIRFVELCQQAGFRPVLGSIPVGNPGGENGGLAKILQFAPALRAAKNAGGALAYHAYTIKYTKDLEIEEHYSHRYRFWYRGFTGEYADLADLPLLLTEGGVDEYGDAEHSGWKARGSWRKYVDWLKWHDCELRKDPYVLGVTLYQQGCQAAWGGWRSFDHDVLADWFVWYWNEGARNACPQ
jgi:hypothetical protein